MFSFAVEEKLWFLSRQAPHSIKQSKKYESTLEIIKKYQITVGILGGYVDCSKKRLRHAVGNAEL